MEYINFKRSVQIFADVVIEEARKNLGKNDNQDGKLANSLSSKIITTDSAFIVKFFMENYGVFQDQGVRGVDSYYADQVTASSPFSYKSKGGNQRNQYT